VFVFTKDWKLINKYGSLIEAARNIGAPVQNVGRACQNKKRTCKGFHVMYAEDYIKELSY
jgi:hypothetical protein